MKKNGFTLIELIATIGLMTILASVILINMAGIKNNQDESSASRFKAMVEEAACTYVDMSDNYQLRQDCKNNSNDSRCKIKLSLLISNEIALVEPDKKDLETNKTAEQEKDDVYVWVHFEDEGSYKVKKCTFVRGNI